MLLAEKTDEQAFAGNFACWPPSPATRGVAEDLTFSTRNAPRQRG